MRLWRFSLCIIAPGVDPGLLLQLPWTELLCKPKNGDELSHGFLRTFVSLRVTSVFVLCIIRFKNQT